MADDQMIQNEEKTKDEGIPEDVDLSDATPVCPQCFQPFDPLEHYCKNCGQAVGNLTPYIPFVNIPYNYSIFSNMWKKTWYDDQVGIGHKIFYLFLIVLMTPILLVSLPFMLRNKK